MLIGEPGVAAEASERPALEIFCDGACQGNPGPGGWGSITRDDVHEQELSGYDPDTTNNRMELTAAIEALKAIQSPRRVTVYSDSKYVIDGFTQYLPRWKAQGWWKSDGSPVMNRDLWEELDVAAQRHEVTWKWVKGHAGHPENERADQLANAAIVARKGRRGALKKRPMVEDTLPSQ